MPFGNPINVVTQIEGKMCHVEAVFENHNILKSRKNVTGTDNTVDKVHGELIMSSGNWRMGRENTYIPHCLHVVMSNITLPAGSPGILIKSSSVRRLA